MCSFNSLTVDTVIVMVKLIVYLQKMNILEPSFRLEQFPPEIDVYRVPHDRMKQLVSTISEKLPEIQVYSLHCLIVT